MKRWIIATLTLALLAPAAGAANPPLTAEQKATMKTADFQKQLTGLPAGSRYVPGLRYGANALPVGDPDSVQALDLFVPPGTGPFPLILWIHGGGWHGGSNENSGVSLARPFLAHGFALAAIDYRFVQDAGFPAQIEDCDAALIWLRKHATEYRLDPDRVGVAGHSAGAHLAALMAVTGDRAIFAHDAMAARVQAAVCWATPADLDRERGRWPKSSMLYNTKDPMQKAFPGGVYDAEVAREASPASYVHAGVPPMLIVHGAKDDLVPMGQVQAFADNLKKAGVDVTFRVDPERGHNVMSVLATDEAIKFFQRTLMNPPTAPH
jgi:acetyl esterase/lipase